MKPALTARAQRRAAWQSQLRGASARTQPSARGAGAIHVRIDELSLNGFAKGSERRIAAAFERELNSRLTREIPPGWGTASTTEALTARMRVRSQRDPVVIGEQLATAVLSAYREDRR